MSSAPQAPDWDTLKARLFAQNQFAIKLGLDNMKEALRMERLSRVSHRVVLVAGTNGKGTTSSMLAAILNAHGLRVGLYTSPHLIDFNERFRVDGVPVAREDVRVIAARILKRYGDPAPGSGVPRLTYFELTTLIAGALFERERVDVGVYEVGLGGRLDATNAFEPDLAIITTLGFDHQAYLGDTIEEIAGEKAGIMRRGVHAVCGRQEHDGAARALAGCAARVGAVHTKPDEAPLEPGTRDVVWDAVSRRSAIQRAHAETAVAASRILLGAGALDDHVASGLERARWPGRFEARRVDWRGRALELFIDGAHNLDGLRAFNDWLAPRGVEHILFGAMSDKPLERMISSLNEAHGVPTSGVLIQNVRAATARQLEDALASNAAPPAKLSDALDALPEHVRRVAVCGSLYLVGELYAELGMRPEELVTVASGDGFDEG